MKIKIYADGAQLDDMLAAYRAGMVSGFTTNPTLMRQAGITDYEGFARQVLGTIKDRSISFEVFADDFPTMAAQARKIAALGDNVYVKIPVTNTRGESAAPLIHELSAAGIKLNVTAILTLDQVGEVTAALSPETSAIVSVFAGRVADTGRDPVPLMRDALAICAARPKAELLWASPREVLNIYQADQIGCHIITVTLDLLKKLALRDKDLGDYSLDTVKMFYNDGVAAGFTL
jgi:transaldolase